MMSAMKQAYRFGMKDFMLDYDALCELSKNLQSVGIHDRLLFCTREIFCHHVDEWISQINELKEISINA